ncbi:MAG: SIS domain-containing protein [Proteobacteria bacterium]|nr:SIS domain-containing protein [Pseudomonadota bacterium]
MNPSCTIERQQPKDRVLELFNQSIALKKKIIEQNCLSVLVDMADLITKHIIEGGTLYFCGNGGSAADAQHLAAELLVRLRPHVNRRSIPALSLATDVSSLTACGNDYSFDEIFSRNLSGLGKQGDMVLGITTSGRSPNVLKAFDVAREMGIKTLGFLGGAKDGEPALSKCDLAFVVPSSDTGRIQEAHITAGHALMELVEDMLILKGYAKKG